MRELHARRQVAESSVQPCQATRSTHHVSEDMRGLTTSHERSQVATAHTTAHIDPNVNASVSTRSGFADVESSLCTSRAELSLATFRPPPGLPPPPALPCHGSALHASGQCQPCALHWAKGGCPLSQECKCCHLCMPSARWTLNEACQMALSERPQSQETCMQPVRTNSTAPSGVPRVKPEPAEGAHVTEAFNPGSVLHSLGECEPCAWFWKPQGCLNGDSCRRCHLCPAGETRERKKTKTAVIRATRRAEKCSV